MAYSNGSIEDYAEIGEARYRADAAHQRALRHHERALGGWEASQPARSSCASQPPTILGPRERRLETGFDASPRSHKMS